MDLSDLLEIGLPVCCSEKIATEEKHVASASVDPGSASLALQSSSSSNITSAPLARQSSGVEPKHKQAEDVPAGKRLLFLDVDGVLHPLRVRLLTGSQKVDMSHCFQTSCMGELKRIVDITGAALVLSSSWRRYENARETLAVELAKVGLHFTECTTTAGGESSSDRVDQILDFVARASNVLSWAVVDDDDLAPSVTEGSESMMRAVFRQNFVRTDADVGLNPEKAERLISILLDSSDSESDVDMDDSLAESPATTIAQMCLRGFPAAGWCAPASIEVVSSRVLQNLWSGLGSIMEIEAVAEGVTRNIILKNISRPTSEDFEKQRDYDSYIVEGHFYDRGHASKVAAAGCRCPLPLHVECTLENCIRIGMTRLQGLSCAGGAGKSQVQAALSWLARFHATYWGHSRANEAVSSGLQSQGCYWNLDARQLELARTPNEGLAGRLRLAARALDGRMKADMMQTICHGDPKDANIIDAEDTTVGLCDFQWVGKAPPTKDVAYCLACGAESLTADEENAYLQFYYEALTTLLGAQGDDVPSMHQVRVSYSLAMADLARWMAGWGWWGHVRRVKTHAEDVLNKLDGGQPLLSDLAYIEKMEYVFPA